MPQTKYRIYELSARTLMSYAREENGVYTFQLNRTATDHCMIPGAKHEQDNCALFFQLMCQLRGDRYREREGEGVITDLADMIFYMDFSGIFDRRGSSHMQRIRREKAKDMFRPEGVTLDFGRGPHRYVSFERSASMSRQSRLSFIRADLYVIMRQRIMLDMTLDRCQLSKLYAYNGLMFSSGTRVDGIRIDKPHRVIVVDNPKKLMQRVPVITVVEGDKYGKYYREETIEDINITCFDGVGLISKEYAETVDKAYCGRHCHTSFQIRLPYIKGMLHQVDFKDFLKRSGTQVIQDIWGINHPIQNVDIILTRSQFKADRWLQENDMSWKDYWKAFRKYRHALYITNTNKEQAESLVALNYQFLSTVSIQPEEFRPADLPDGWNSSPQTDKRQWLTKATETAYYNFCANGYFRKKYFLDGLSQPRKSRAYILAAMLNKNPRFINEPIYTDALETQAKILLKNYAIGHLLVPGDNRFLSGDLLELLRQLMSPRVFQMPAERVFCDAVTADFFAEDSFYAPGATYEHDESCTLLRNPHIARNEELQLSIYPDGDELREHYLGHLTDVVFVSADSLAAERLGGADYDGDQIKTIADPILNRCVKRNYEYEVHQQLSNNANLPLLKIPSLSAPLSDPNDWRERFRTVENTFAARIGQICNAAMDRSVIAYSDSADPEERKRCRREIETLAILSGLEIDAAKSGVRPDLDEYIGAKHVKRSTFLQYKYLAEQAEETRRAWYEPTHKEKLDAFFSRTDWSTVESHIEKLPYLARQLERNTPRIKPTPAEDRELFTFAQEGSWQDRLNPKTLSSVSELLKDYERCLSRIRACCVPVKDRQKKSDIERILYARGQEDLYDSDELYAFLRQLPPERITALRHSISDQQWPFMAADKRELFLAEYLPEATNYYDLLTDFRQSGYRVLGDLVCDIDDENNAQERKQLLRETDTSNFTAMMKAYMEHSFSADYKEPVSKKCRELLNRIVRPGIAVQYVVALGKRNLLWELLIDQIEKNVLEVPYAE